MAQVYDGERAAIIASQQVQVSERDMNMYRQHFCKDAPDHEWSIFVQKCTLYGLNPMLNEIYLVGRNTKEGDKWVKKFATQVSITGLISLAERTNKYEGHTTPEYFDEDGNKYEIWSTKHGKHPYAIRIGVYKRGQREAPLITTYFHERAQYRNKSTKELTQMWEAQGIHMLLKCALAAATRWQFSESCSGVYIHEEMQAADTDTPPVSIMPNPTIVESVPDGLHPTVQAARDGRKLIDVTQPATDTQIRTIHTLCQKLDKPVPAEQMTLASAKETIDALTKEYREKPKATQAPVKPVEQRQSDVKLQALGKIAQRCKEVFGEEKGPVAYRNIRAHVVKTLELGDVPDEWMPDEALTQMWNTLNTQINKQSAMAGTSGK